MVIELLPELLDIGHFGEVLLDALALLLLLPHRVLPAALYAILIALQVLLSLLQALWPVRVVRISVNVEVDLT